MKVEAPHKAIRVELKVDGHTWEDLLGNLRNAVTQLSLRDGPHDGDWWVGGGSVMNMKYDAAMTEEQWLVDLDTYVEATRKERRS